MGLIILGLLYSQTCLKGSPKRRSKGGCIRKVTPQYRFVPLYFGSRDPEKVAAQDR